MQVNVRDNNIEQALRALKKRFPNLKLINNGQRVGPFLFWGRSKLPVSHN